LLLVSSRGAAQVAPLIANISSRQTTSLDGQWQAIVDPYDVGALDYRAQPLKNNQGFYKNYKPQSESELVEYDFDGSGQLHVPGDWNTQRESLLFYEGSVWYKRSFDYAKSPKNRLFLHFGACNYLAAVYLNGEELGSTRAALPLLISKSRIASGPTATSSFSESTTRAERIKSPPSILIGGTTEGLHAP